ncbi:glycoside hydrolase family 70 protein [Parenemella sanctibonifatiensis]|uniref:dextransucrase n=1 Tax=Parenemella sanctibonifatiensis TaxID=2016505 RepID=A0A255EP73_9ACTN|nr:glycoside hydrolase family 70 protein [Parenemella sanctibonifatiensis]OYN89933.1 hypothetical protein CGZ91_10600 [Parenemella sanctibonifatiensis]
MSYLETYNNGQNAYLDGSGNQQLAYDGDLFFALQNTLGSTNTWWMVEAYARGQVNRTRTGPARPNWSFVSNHDQEKNRVNRIMMRDLGITPNTQWGNQTPRSFAEEYTREGERAALEKHWNDLSAINKRYTPVNVPSMYAVILTNANTVPTVYYGDLYRTDAAYWSTPTPYHAEITALMKARKAYARGAQRVDLFRNGGAPGQEVVASVRAGDGRGTGLATVLSNVPTVNTTVRVFMGANHANQAYIDVTGKNSGRLVTDGQGYLTVPVKGIKDADVNGYLGVWAPAGTEEVVATHGAIHAKWLTARSLVGNPTSPELCTLRNGGCFQWFQGGRIYWSPTTGAHVTLGDIDKRWAAQGWENGALGYPTSSEQCRDGHCIQTFQGGTITWRPDGRGGLVIWGRILARWQAEGGVGGTLGLPTGEERCGWRDGGCFQDFDRGHIYWSLPTDAQFVRGEVFNGWGRLGWENGRLGYPTTGEMCGLVRSGCFQRFQGGSMYWSLSSGAHPSWGLIGEEWGRTGWERGRYGYPIDMERCTVGARGRDCHQRFQGGTIRWSDARGFY